VNKNAHSFRAPTGRELPEVIVRPPRSLKSSQKSSRGHQGRRDLRELDLIWRGKKWFIIISLYFGTLWFEPVHLEPSTAGCCTVTRRAPPLPNHSGGPHQLLYTTHRLLHCIATWREATAAPLRHEQRHLTDVTCLKSEDPNHLPMNSSAPGFLEHCNCCIWMPTHGLQHSNETRGHRRAKGAPPMPRTSHAEQLLGPMQSGERRRRIEIAAAVPLSYQPGCAVWHYYCTTTREALIICCILLRSRAAAAAAAAATRRRQNVIGASPKGRHQPLSPPGRRTLEICGPHHLPLNCSAPIWFVLLRGTIASPGFDNCQGLANAAHSTTKKEEAFGP
jgi:hypothetical protein